MRSVLPSGGAVVVGVWNAVGWPRRRCWGRGLGQVAAVAAREAAVEQQAGKQLMVCSDEDHRLVADEHEEQLGLARASSCAGEDAELARAGRRRGRSRGGGRAASRNAVDGLLSMKIMDSSRTRAHEEQLGRARAATQEGTERGQVVAVGARRRLSSSQQNTFGEILQLPCCLRHGVGASSSSSVRDVGVGVEAGSSSGVRSVRARRAPERRQTRSSQDTQASKQARRVNQSIRVVLTLPCQTRQVHGRSPLALSGCRPTCRE